MYCIEPLCFLECPLMSVVTKVMIVGGSRYVEDMK